MKIKRELVLTYEVEGDDLIFDDLRTLSLAMGTQSVSGNLSIYNVAKKDGRYYVPIKSIKERFEKKRRFVKKQNEYLEIMAEIIEKIK